MKHYFKIGFVLFALAGLCLSACSTSFSKSSDSDKASFFSFGNSKEKTKLSPNEFIEWVENPEHKLSLTKTIDEFTFNAIYKPISYLALIEETDTSEITLANFNKIKDSYKGMKYFTFKIRCDKTNDELLKYNLPTVQDYYNRLDYYSFKAQNDFSLFDGKDTIACELYHFERTFGVAPILTFVLGFPMKEGSEKKVSDMFLSYNESIFGKGIIRMKFDKNVLENIPELEITNK